MVGGEQRRKGGNVGGEVDERQGLSATALMPVCGFTSTGRLFGS